MSNPIGALNSCFQSVVKFHNEGTLELSQKNFAFISKLTITETGEEADNLLMKIGKMFALTVFAIPLCTFNGIHYLYDRIATHFQTKPAGVSNPSGVVIQKTVTDTSITTTTAKAV